MKVYTEKRRYDRYLIIKFSTKRYEISFEDMLLLPLMAVMYVLAWVGVLLLIAYIVSVFTNS